MSFLKKLTTRNVGKVDRLLRAAPAVLVAALWANGTLTGTALALAGIAAVMLLITAVTGMCSIYAMLGISTCPTKSSQ